MTGLVPVIHVVALSESRRNAGAGAAAAGEENLGHEAPAEAGYRGAQRTGDVASDRFYVKNLTLENFRCFEKAELGPFDPHFNLLVGTNGSGKSSVLLALANLFRPLARGRWLEERTVGESDMRIGERDRRAILTRFPQPAPWTLKSEANWSGQDLIARESFDQISRSDSAIEKFWRPSSGQQVIFDANFASGQWPALIVFYSTDRRFQTIDLPQYQLPDWRNAGYSVNALREWMREETLIALQDGAAANSLILDVASVKSQLPPSPVSILKIVQNAMCSAVESATNVEYIERRKDVIVSIDNGPSQEFSKMSDGQRALIGLVGDIARRICTLYGSAYGFDPLKKTTGLVLIDELDLHLHPRWQRRVIGDLKRIFPNIQFFATTHSPQIIGEARPEEIVMLTANGRQKRPTHSFGMNSDWVLECVMEAEGRDPEIAKRIRIMLEAIENNRFDDARSMIAELREVIGEAPDVVAAESYIWNVEHDGEEAAE
jgi:predicted ATP-binding protein involved in virulence